ncbi:MAG: rod shape-determining protein RodA [Ruminococcaceae bacterium]|nr:rod shape-determining protein RodA [Oscillospiraceae bacterium]
MGRLLGRIADFIRETDKILLILCTTASLYGVFAVFSSTRFESSVRPTFVQAFCLCAGIGAALFISAFNFTNYTRRWLLAAILGVVPVILTFFIGIAPAGTDDKAWLDLGFTAFQPSELMKICFIITFSAHLSSVKDKINKPSVLLPACLHGGFPVVLIILQGDFGTALVFAAMFIIMLWSAGVSWKYFVGAFSALLVASPFIYFFLLNDEHRARIVSIFNLEADIQGDGYQQYRGRVALANGGFFGQGYLKGSLTQAGGVPEGHNDFIFVSIGEELGFLGCIAVLILLAAICLRILRIAAICRNESGKLICIGIFSMLFAQIIINIGMCISVLPVIGITLPFFSAGGTSLLTLYLGIGLALSVYKNRNSRTIYLHD